MAGVQRVQREEVFFPERKIAPPPPSRVTSMTGQTLPVDCRNLPANVYVQLGSSSRHHGWVKECKVGGWGWGRGEVGQGVTNRPGRRLPSAIAPTGC